MPVPDVDSDPLKFRDTKRYTDRLKEARIKTGLSDAIKVGTGTVEGVPMTIAAHDPDFIGGSLELFDGTLGELDVAEALDRLLEVAEALTELRLLAAATCDEQQRSGDEAREEEDSHHHADDRYATSSSHHLPNEFTQVMTPARSGPTTTRSWARAHWLAF